MDTPEFKHFLLTNFNLGLYDRTQKTRTGDKIKPVEWMDGRMELFKRFCAPSVNNQTCKNFEWLIVFDKETPVGYIDEIVRHCDYTALFGDNFKQACVECIESRLTDEDRVITSRMDSDYGLHKDYIKLIQDWFSIYKKTGILSYPNGWIYNPEKSTLFDTRCLKNPFLTLIEKRCPKPVRTILAHRNKRVTDMFRLFLLDRIKDMKIDEHMWTQVVHGENLSNYCWGNKSNIENFIPGDYGL